LGVLVLAMRGLRRCLPFGGGGCCCGEGVGRGGSVADGLVWDVALKAHASGDYSIAVAQANESLEDQAQVLAAPAATLVGVFDGHGGPEAARFVNRRLFSHIQGELDRSLLEMISIDMTCFSDLTDDPAQALRRRTGASRRRCSRRRSARRRRSS
jgi:hypothetical protein